jgi:Uma2 family endonuclease
MAAIPFHQEIEYPESDGQPLESDAHVQEMLDLRVALRKYFRGQDVYVGSNLFIYYEEGNPRASLGPDVFVTLGVSSAMRRLYKVWEEGKPPTVVFEITSRTTRREDLGRKKDLYARLGVEEYFLHDVLGECMMPRLQGFRLEDGLYRRIEPDADGCLESRALGLRMREDGMWLRLTDATTGELLLTPEEEILKAEREEAGRREAEQRATHAEDRARALEEELSSLRKKLGRA